MPDRSWIVVDPPFLPVPVHLRERGIGAECRCLTGGTARAGGSPSERCVRSFPERTLAGAGSQLPGPVATSLPQRRRRGTLPVADCRRIASSG